MNATGIASTVKAELTKIRSLPRGKRWEYIWEYYRLTVFLMAFAIFFIWMIGTFVVNSVVSSLFPKEPFSIAFASSDYTGNEAWMETCLSAIGYDAETEKFQTLTSAPYSTATDDFLTKTTVWFVNGQPDILIVDEHSYQYLLKQESLADLTEAWPQELLALAEGYWDSDYGLEISATPFAEAYGLDGEPVYLCMYLHGDGFQRALDMVEYILSEK